MKTFLSQTFLDYVDVAKRELTNPYNQHQWIWENLPADPGATRDFLFRFDVLGNGRARILLLSERKPVNPQFWETTELAEQFLGHAVYRFQIRVNPTMRVAISPADGSRKTGPRKAICDKEKCRTWFSRKFADLGCEVMGLELSPFRREEFSKNERRVTIVTVDATGIIRVKDPVVFRNGFDKGMGTAKGFGLGLLMLQPLSNN